ncbi:MAG: YfcE family phosphodiesterase [Proteobacteria bacterium]|nr:YfcE family phosphodiesterase [Pseudomonadota bacterium]MBU1738814.1 YfcE family phosphodiesterase [Pseudomonadota bacterium]
MTRIGILSDTHLTRPDELFTARVSACFAEIPVIIHAGDLTSPSVLEVFAGKEVYAVHGNMCDHSSRSTLPPCRKLAIDRFEIVVVHGYGFGYGNDLEERLFSEFTSADCIIYGHTHSPVCHTVGEVLIMNPGSFQSTGRFGSPGTYGVLTVGEKLCGRIHTVPEG